MTSPLTSPRSGSFRNALYNLRWFLVATSVLMSVRYIYWRATSTLNYQSGTHFVISLLLLLAEIYGFAALLLFFAQTLTPVSRKSVPVNEKEYPSVDVFVTILNEPEEILYRTLVGCEALDYPQHLKTVYVLDDGPREEIRALTEHFGFRYLSRKDRKNAKAGNLNHALSQSKSDLIMALDTDHIPVRSFLKETVGFFVKDLKVAYVQAPHHFYNPDCYQKNLNYERTVAHEQDLFFGAIQPGRDSVNSAIFAGSSAVLRRKALETIGGFQTACAIEDLHTGMALHKQGFKSVYYPEPISAGLSPESFSAYLTQKSRWTRGGVQLFFLDNPILARGLTMIQRVHYTASLLYFFHGIARLIYLAAPVAFLLFQYNPIVAGTSQLLWHFLPYYALYYLAFCAMDGRYRNPFWSDVYEATSAFHLAWTTVKAVFMPDRLVFKVTPKGQGAQKSSGGLTWGDALVHFALAALLVAGIFAASARYFFAEINVEAYFLSCAWALFNLSLISCAIGVAWERPRLRLSYRLPRYFACDVEFEGTKLSGLSETISEGGISVKFAGHHLFPNKIKLTIRGPEETTEIEASTVRNEWLDNDTTVMAAKFEDVYETLRASLIRQIFCSTDSWREDKFPLNPSFFKSFSQIPLGLLSAARASSPGRPRRIWPRVKAQLRYELESGGTVARGLTHDVAAHGVSLVWVKGKPPRSGKMKLALPNGESYICAVKRVRRLGAPDTWGFHFEKPYSLDFSKMRLVAQKA